MVNIIMSGIALAIFLGLIGLLYARNSGRNQEKWFAGGISLGLIATAITALVLYFKKRR